MPIVFGFLLLVLVSTCAVKFFTPPKSPQQQAASQKRQETDDAKRMAKVFVREKARLAANAEFAPLQDFRVAEKGGVWQVEAYVETPAANGSRERTPFVCELARKGSQWSLLKLTMPR